MVLYLKRVKGLGGCSGVKRDDCDKNSLFCKAFFSSPVISQNTFYTLGPDGRSGQIE